MSLSAGSCFSPMLLSNKSLSHLREILRLFLSNLQKNSANLRRIYIHFLKFSVTAFSAGLFHDLTTKNVIASLPCPFPFVSPPPGPLRQRNVPTLLKPNHPPSSSSLHPTKPASPFPGGHVARLCISASPPFTMTAATRSAQLAQRNRRVPRITRHRGRVAAKRNVCQKTVQHHRWSERERESVMA